MARMVKGLMIAALMAGAAMPAAGLAQGVQYYVKEPTSGMNLEGILKQQILGSAGNALLGMQNGLNITDITNMDFKKVLAASVMGAIGQQMGLNINPSAMLGGTGGLTNSMGFSNTGNFGGFGLAAGGAGGMDMGSFIGQVVGQIVTGGIQSALQGGGSNFGGSNTDGTTTVVDGVTYTKDPVTGEYLPADTDTDTDTATDNGYKATEDPVISQTAAVKTTSVNYTSGYYDAKEAGLSPDPRFRLPDGSYDSNYWAGYQKGLTEGADAPGGINI